MTNSSPSQCACFYTYDECIELLKQSSRFSLPARETEVIGSISNELYEISQQQPAHSGGSGGNGLQRANAFASGASKHSTSSFSGKRESKPTWRQARRISVPSNHADKADKADKARKVREADGSDGKKATPSSTLSDWRSSTPTKKKSTLTKQINLILNSAVETNAMEIVDRIKKLLETSEENPSEISDKLCDQIVINAFAQAFYSETYVTIITELSKMMSSMWESILKQCLQTVDTILEGKQMNKHAIKGFGSFIAHIYLSTALDDSRMQHILKSIANGVKSDSSSTVRDLCCDILVTILQRVIQTKPGKKATTYPAVIKQFIQKELVGVWDDTAIPMRIRVRLLDIKDIY